MRSPIARPGARRRARNSGTPPRSVQGEGLSDIADAQYASPETQDRPDSDIAAVEEVSTWAEDARRFYREHHDLGAQCGNYLWKNKRYKDDAGSEIELDRRRVKPKGNEINNLVRHKTAMVAGPATYEECWPTDARMDPLAAEGATRILKHIFQSPRRRYKLRRRNAINSGFVTGVGYLRADWYEPSQGLRFEVVPHDHVLVCPGYQDMHDEACPYVIEWADLEIEDIQSRAATPENPNGWQNTDNLWPDNRGTYKSSEEFNRAPASPANDQMFGKPTVRVLICRERRSRVTEQRIGVGNRILPDDERYMYCFSCGYKTREHAMVEGKLPIDGEPCPHCLNLPPPVGPAVNYLRRIDAERTDAQVLKYPNGRMRIVAPFQQRLFFDGGWPEDCRSYPYYQFRPYEHPTEHIGQNDVALHATKQAILDSLTRFGYEQMRASRRIFIVGGGQDGMGLVNAHQRPFRMTDEDGHFAYTKSMNVEGLIKEFQGSGIPAGLPVLYNLVYQSLDATLGFRDFGLTADRSKDIAAASLEKIQEVGEVPVQDHRDVSNDEESVFKGVCLDIWVARATPELATKALGEGNPMLGIPSGPEILWLLRQTDTRDMDVVVTASPTIRAMNRDQMAMVQEWVTLYRMDPQAALVIAEMSNIAPSIIRRLQALPPAPPQEPPVSGGNGTPSPGNRVAANGGAQPAATR